MKIQGAIALVTGSNRGLGSAIVSALVRAGATKVYAASRAGKQIRALDSRLVPLELDITNGPQVAAAAETAGDVTLLINNAGTLTSFNVLTATQAELDTDFRTNLFGTLALVKAFIPVLERAAAGATIVNVLSLSALASVPSMGGYSASKAASYSVTQSLRAELRHRRIAVLAALAGPVDTDMVRALKLPKANPAEVAAALLAGVERGDEEIFPDPMAQQMGPLWNKSPKEFEQAFADY